ncbi:hypothetical protein BD311DRAFT_742894 [Dichomitus squalens]|uniref:Uncharacterized protein n=1 Tax=Dichomitus squalens TaxID=114155 RepID=A0A4Q9MA66_9APHY|nr:hypothetical protein BD311DRAFT_742894 [Dichomitus squalens]
MSEELDPYADIYLAFDHWTTPHLGTYTTVMLEVKGKDRQLILLIPTGVAPQNLVPATLWIPPMAGVPSPPPSLAIAAQQLAPFSSSNPSAAHSHSSPDPVLSAPSVLSSTSLSPAPRRVLIRVPPIRSARAGTAPSSSQRACRSVSNMEAVMLWARVEANARHQKAQEERSARAKARAARRAAALALNNDPADSDDSMPSLETVTDSSDGSLSNLELSYPYDL